MDTLRAVVIAENVLTRKIVSDIVNKSKYAKVIHFSSRAELVMEWLSYNVADIIFISYKMQGVSSLEMMKKIKEMNIHTEFVVICDGKDEAISDTYELLQKGALDTIIINPLKNEDNLNEQMLKNLEVLFSQMYLKNSSNYSLSKNVKDRINSKANEYSSEIYFKDLQTTRDEKRDHRKLDPEMILIASSTGGPVALEYLFSNMNTKINVPILLVQHIPAGFTETLASSIGRKTSIVVTEAKDGMKIESGKVYIAPGGYHMTLRKDKLENFIQLDESPYVNGVRPSADVLFESIARNSISSKFLAVILTGMGNDGTEGIEKIKKRNTVYTICQSERSCVVYGMPKCVVEAGLADEVLDLKDIPGKIFSIFNSKGVE